MSRRQINFNDSERFLLNYYTNIYNEQIKSINLMYIELKETRSIIDYITRMDERTRMDNSRMDNSILPNINIDFLGRINQTNENQRNQNQNEINENQNENQNQNQNENQRNNNRSTAYYRWDYYIPIDNLEDISVYPTQEEINNNTRIVTYNNVINPLNNSCPITLEQFEENTECIQIIGCNHLFNQNGLRCWLRGNVRCPICRYDIRNRNENSESENIQIDNSFNIIPDQIINSLFSSRRRRRATTNR